MIFLFPEALEMKKWANMRDSWMKYAKKVKECKSGSAAKNIKKYVFYEQMKFLKKVADHRQTKSNLNADTSNDSASNENTVDLTTREIPKKNIKKPTEITEVDKKFMRFLDTTEKEDKSRIMNFFKGIAPIVDLFSDDDIIEFQSEVLEIIKNIKKKHTLNSWTRNQYHNLETAVPSTNISTYGYQTQGYSSYSESQPSTSTTLETVQDYEQPQERRPDSQSSYVTTDSVYSEINEFDFNV